MKSLVEGSRDNGSALAVVVAEALVVVGKCGFFFNRSSHLLVRAICSSSASPDYCCNRRDTEDQPQPLLNSRFSSLKSRCVLYRDQETS